MSNVRADFERIAEVSGEEWGHNGLYHGLLARHVPRPCREALDVGCGTGAFSRLLAGVSDRVLALDLSPKMIGLARERSAQVSNIDFEVADVLARELPAARFDCIASIATLHHMPVREVMPKLKGALKEGGVLLVLDLFQSEGLSDALRSALAVPVSVGLRLVRSGRLRPPREVRRAWDEHGRHDSYLTMAQVREVCSEMLPGAVVQRHLLWRYSVVWKKSAPV